MSIELLQAASDRAASVLAGVGPDDLVKPTPCAAWQVRDLINHMVGAHHWFADTLDTGTAPGNTGDADVTGGDMQAAYADAAKRSISAFGEPGAMEKMLTLPFGQIPAGAFVMLAANDTYVHAWDLAKATGQPTDVAPEVAEQILGFAQQAIADAARGPEGKAPFGARVEAPDTASAPDRLAAFCGRTP